MAFIHGLLLAGIFVFQNRLNTKSNKFLALSLFGMSVILGYEFAFWLDAEDKIPVWIDYFPLYIRSLIPIGLYFFVKFLINPESKLSRIDKMATIIIGLEVFLHLLYTPLNIFVSNVAAIEIYEYYIIILGWLLSIIAGILFLPRAFRVVLRYQKHLYNHYSTTSDKSLAWLRNFLIAVNVIMVFWIISFVQFLLGNWDAGEKTFAVVTIGLVILLFWVGYSIILKYSWFQIVALPDSRIEEKSNGNKLSSKTDTYHQNLLHLLRVEKVYEDPELTLDNLAERLEISSGYLSQIINQKEKKNFFEFINTYRVEAVKEKLMDESYSHYTIMGLALESGFKSKSTFNAVFKKITGTAPSSYKKLGLS